LLKQVCQQQTSSAKVKYIIKETKNPLNLTLKGFYKWAKGSKVSNLLREDVEQLNDLRNDI